MLARVLPSTQKPSFRKLSVEPCPRSRSRWPVGGLWWTLLFSPCAKLGVLSTYFPHRIKTKFLSLEWKGFTIASHPIFWALQRKVLWESNGRHSPHPHPAVQLCALGQAHLPSGGNTHTPDLTEVSAFGFCFVDQMWWELCIRFGLVWGYVCLFVSYYKVLYKQGSNIFLLFFLPFLQWSLLLLLICSFTVGAQYVHSNFWFVVHARLPSPNCFPT